jgi:HD-GYP domain-containing protein (c-di-GMP phosphodiesterase class II)
MNTYPVEELRENSYFDAPVFLDVSYILLSSDTRASVQLVERLKRWGYTSVYTDGKPSEAPPSYISSGAAATASSVLEMDVRDKQQQDAARRLYYALINFAVDSFKKLREENRLDLGLTTERVKELIERLKEGREAVLRFPEFVYLSENYLYAHSVHSLILSLAIGDLLKLPPHRMIELGIAALLHDIGMVKLPEQLYLNSGPLGAKELQMVRAHTTLGYRLLKAFSVAEEIALAAYEHHERLDGSGYPQGLKGEKITLYSRIVAAVCSYEAITCKRSFKEQKDGHSAELALLKDRNTLYDDQVVRALIVCLSVYPLGSLVELSDGSIARVARLNPESARYPLVELVLDKERKRITEPVLVRTTASEGLAVVRSLSPAEAERLGLS